MQMIFCKGFFFLASSQGRVKSMFLLFKMSFRSVLIFLMCWCIWPMPTQAQELVPKREMRAVWIASVANIDWPSAKNLTPERQQEEYLQILDSHVNTGLNAVFVQVRPSTDALYDSKQELWSEWLSGKQGTMPQPYYDPLQFMVKEAHQRGLEFHAWFNPYRAVFDTASSSIHPEHISRKRPEWFIAYGRNKFFDPGIPQVRHYIADIIGDVVRRYDIDGVHFDDYFYPYQIPGQAFKDSMSYIRYNPKQLGREDWRRSNVDSLIHLISEHIRQQKPYVKFGVSPFAIWRNQATDPLGSPTRAGTTTYDHLYADVRTWLQKGWIDYVVPQIYFTGTYRPAPYYSLTEWWMNNSFGRHLYVGHAAYKVGSYRNNDSIWRDYSELPNQIRFNRLCSAGVQGSVYFSSKSLTRNLGGFRDSLARVLYRYPALIPAMPWKDSLPPAPPKGLEAFKSRKGVWLHWENASDATYYIAYRFKKGEIINFNHAQAIVGISRENGNFMLDDQITEAGDYLYYLTAADRLHNESRPSLAAVVSYAPEDFQQIHWYDFLKVLWKLYVNHHKT
jgi:uncharacterized lipoprotein YddW (UPF0748 family)